MSYDISLNHPDTPDSDLYWRNHTSNTAAMWREAGVDLHDLDGKTGQDLANAVTPALAVITSDPARFERHVPTNKWGTVATTVEFLADLVKAGSEHPDAIVTVSA